MAATAPSPSVGPAFEPPDELDDYRIGHELGRGRAGRVYLAEDTLLARPVAIKFIATPEPDVALRRRFLLEARAAARIQHPNVASVYRIGELDGRPYLVGELVRGRSLAALPRPLPAARVLELAVELARGLAAAHRQGVVHGDVKAGNVVVTDDGTAKLIDFGLARLVQDGADERGAPLGGTPDHMAPELWSGQPASRRSDVYALGVLLYELATGATPFAEIPAGELRRIVRERPPPPLLERAPATDARLTAMIDRCLARDPGGRFASAEELRAALEPLLAAPAGAIAFGANPYRGLRAFEASHRAVFFGRSFEASTILERLRTDPLVIVAGDSGVGKSSLLRAGVIPAILDGALATGPGWTAITLVPGRRPLAALAQALAEPALAARVMADPASLPRELRRWAGDRELLLFVDQLEELVAVAEPDHARAFEEGLAALAEGVPGVRVVASARADFLSRLAALPHLGRDLARFLCFVAPLPPERLRDVIVGPAAVTGVRFESDDLIDELVEAGGQAGSGGLPLLSFALAALWEAHDRERALITRASRDAMGGVAGALARHADGVMDSLPADVRGPARRALRRLVSAVGTRVRRTEAELAAGDGTRRALESLVKGRLLVVHDGEEGATYELAHEVLIHGWSTLRGWLEADAEAAALRERLGLAAGEWQRQGRRPDLTWRGPQLAQARALDPAELTAREAAFVAASIAAARRRSWILRATAAAVVVAVLAVVVVQRHLARTRLARAVAVEIAAAGEHLAAARAADDDQRARAAAAFARFDAGDAAAGEAAWAEVVAIRARARAGYREASGRLEAALAKDPARTDVRDLLGDVLLDRALLADQLDDRDQRDELIVRVAAYDRDGRRLARWNAAGTLSVTTPAGTAVAVAAPGQPPRSLGVGEVTTSLAPGAYVVTMAAPGRATVAVPVAVPRAGEVGLSARLPRAEAVPPGFVYVPPGELIYGSRADEDTRITFFQTEPAHRRATAGYLIARTEVTIGDWLAYVDAQPEPARAALTPRLATNLSGALVIDRGPTGWRIATQPLGKPYRAAWGQPLRYPGRPVRAEVAWTALPITGIAAADVEAYAAWLDRSGRVPGARLCTEVEWERAGRGADGRSYPHGERLEPDDADVDVTYGRDLMGLDPVGSHPASTSPFGLVDMAGNAFEWTVGDHGVGYVARGGSYYHDRKTANLTNRYLLPGGEMRDATLGARLCADLPPGALE
jgi:formylglycine-generating enzyme required for sulfatase activity